MISALPPAHRTRWAGLLGVILLLGACGEAHVVRTTPTAQTQQRPSPPPQPRHAGSGEIEVAHGDTLYGIAFRNGMDFRDLAAINSIVPPYTIYAGEILKLRSASGRSAVAPSAQPVRSATSMASGSGTLPRPAGVAVSTQTPAVSVPAPATSPPSSMPPPTVPSPHQVAAPSASIPPLMAAPIGGFSWRWPAKGALLERFAAGDATKQGIDIAGNAGDQVFATADGVVVYSGSGLVGYGELIIVKHSDEWLSAYGHNRKRLVQEGQRVRAGQPIAEMGSTGAPRDELHFEIRRNGRPVDPLQYLPAR